MTEAQDERYGSQTKEKMNLFIFGIFRFRCRCRFRFSLLGSVPNKKKKKSEGSGFSRNELHPEENKSENVLAWKKNWERWERLWHSGREHALWQRGLGFKSHHFSSLLYCISGLSLIRTLEEGQHYWFPPKNMLSRSAWGKASLILNKTLINTLDLALINIVNVIWRSLSNFTHIKIC